MSRIPKETVDQIIHAADIVEVVGDFVTLKKKGQNMWACCPFHNEKTPSFSVAPAKGIYKCFGCGKAGDSVKFIMDVEGSTYPEALRYLAKKYGIEVKEEQQLTDADTARHNERESLFILSNWAKEYYQQQLLQTEEGRIGLSYFRERQLDKETVKKFELGYSPDAWDGLTTAALGKGFELRYLEATGLTIVKEDGKKYDRFRGRVMFPIHNVSGKVLGFGARTLKSNDPKSPKYLNSPESEIYHKSDVLYGLFHAKQAIRQQDLCYLTEGYLDVISLHQAGIQNVVASSGTSLTEGQIRLIARYTQNITVLYDGDAAGIKASLRGIDLILESGLNVSIVLFPDKEDPDSYVRKVGEEAFKQYLAAHSQDFLSFKTKLLAEEGAHNPAKKAEAIREVVQTIAKIPDAIKRSVFLQECSRIFGIDEQVLLSEYNKIALSKSRQKAAPPDEFLPPLPDDYPFDAPPEAFIDTSELDKINQIKWLEHELIRVLVNYPSQPLQDGTPLSLHVINEVEDVELLTPQYQHIIEEIKKTIQQGLPVTSELFTRHENGDLRMEAIDLMMQTSKYQKSPRWLTHGIYVPDMDEDLVNTVFHAIAHLKWRNAQLLISEQSQKLQQVSDVSELDNLLRLIQQLKAYEVQLGKDALGIVVAK